MAIASEQSATRGLWVRRGSGNGKVKDGRRGGRTIE